MNELVTITHDGLAVTTTTAIADGADQSHRTVVQLVRQRQTDLESFGRVIFEKAPFQTAGGIQDRTIALLNERQATLLMSFMRNNDVVVAFKVRLVGEFYRLAKNEQQPAELSRMDLLKIAMDSEQERLKLAGKVETLEWQAEEDKPKVAFAETVQARAEDMDVRRAAQILSNTYGVSTGQQRLFTQLRQLKWLDKKGRAYQRVVDQKLLREIYKTRDHPRTGDPIPYTQVMVTGKGLARLQELLSTELEAAT